MLSLYEKIDNLCKQKGTNITKMCKEAGVSRSILSDYKAGRTKDITTDNLKKIAAYLNISTDYLLGNEQQEAPALTVRDERDISKKMQETLAQLESKQEALMFDGEPLDDETKELLAISLKNSLELAKKIAKQKYTPKKYKTKPE